MTPRSDVSPPPAENRKGAGHISEAKYARTHAHAIFSDLSVAHSTRDFLRAPTCEHVLSVTNLSVKIAAGRRTYFRFLFL